MLKGTRGLLLAAGALLIVVTPTPSRLTAQEITGTISGTIADSSGAVIPEASVTVTNLRTRAARNTTTTSAGVFFFTSLPIGDYELRVVKEGFKQYQRTPIHLDVNDKLSFDITLQVGVTAQQVTVTGEAAAVEKCLFLRRGRTAKERVAMREAAEPANDVGMQLRPFEQIGIAARTKQRHATILVGGVL